MLVNLNNEIGNIKIGDRRIGPNFNPLIIAEIGINHNGNLEKAVQMIKAAAAQKCECVKFQCHIPDAEMVSSEAKKIIPANAEETIYDIIVKCSFNEEQERFLKTVTEENGMIYLNTPFSREAVDRLERMEIVAYKIGSGECNNYPLVEYISKQKKPIILSTGMNDVKSVRFAVDILKLHHIPFALLHCTSLYPTPYNKVRLNAIEHLQHVFNCVVGLSDHTKNNYCAFGAIALGASILERHFTADKTWTGPDIDISMGPEELKDLIEGSNAIFEARNGIKTYLQEESITAAFAYASVAVINPIFAGEIFTTENLWVKRPGIGEIHAKNYHNILGKKCRVNLEPCTFLKWEDVILDK